MEKEKSENVKCGPVDEFDIQEAVETLKKYARIVQNKFPNSEINLENEFAKLCESAEKLDLTKLKSPMFRRIEDKSTQEESKKLDKEELCKVAKETSNKFAKEKKKDRESFKKFIDDSKDLLKDNSESIKNLELAEKIFLEEEVEPTKDEIELFENVTDQQVQSASENLSVKDLARKLSDLAGKPTTEELKPAVRYLKDLSEKVAGLNLDMADKMLGHEKMGMAAKLNKLILDGKLTESDFDGIVLCGFPKDSIEMWKELYRPANERKKHRFYGASFRRLEQPAVVDEGSPTEDVELGSAEKANAILDEIKETSVPIGWKRNPVNQLLEPAQATVQKQFKDFCENFENVQTLVNATPTKGTKILSTLRMFLDQLIKLVEENSDYNWGDCVLKYGKWLSDYEQGLSPAVVQTQKPTVQCTDCGSPERDMTELKAIASLEQQKEVQRQIKLGETIEFQNQIKILTERMKEKLSFDKFYEKISGVYCGVFYDIQKLFDWAMERTPTATVEIKELAELLRACEDWHANGHVRKSTEYVEWFKQRIEWFEDQKNANANAKVLQGYLSDNDSLLDGLKKKNKQIPKEMAEMISNDIKYSTLPDGSKIKEYYREGVLVRTENLGKMVQSYRGGIPIRAQHYEGDNYNEFMGLKPKNTFKEEPQTKTVMFEENKIPNKVKSELDENGLEKRSYYKGDQFVRSVDAFGDISDKPKNPVVARNIEEIAKEQRETSPLWKSLEGVSKSPFLTGDLKEAAKTLQKYSKILKDGKPFDAKDDQSDSLKQKQDRIKEYRTKTEDEWKNSINNTERILEKKNKPEELSVYEQFVKARQDKSVSELNQSKTFGEVSGNDLEQAAKILQKYAEIVDDNISYQEDNFTATPVDVKGTDGPFRRKLPNKIESNVVEKQEKKSKLNELIRSISQATKKGSVMSTTPKQMFDLSLWQKTKVYFRDLKNKASTLFKSPEITEEEVDRAIRLMEKQIAEIKRSKNPTPEMYAHLFDHLLPGKGGDGCDGRKYPVALITDLFKKREEKIHNDKIKLDQKTKDLLLEFKKKIERLKSDQDSISDNELIEIETIFYLDAGKLLDHIGLNNDRKKFPDLQRYFTSVAIYHHEVSSKNQINIKELKNVYSDFLDKIEWISLKQ